MNATMLARFDSLFEPQIRVRAADPVRSSKTIQQLADVVAARRALIKDRTATTDLAKLLRIALFKRQAGQRLNQIARQMDDLDPQARAIVGADPALQNRLDISTSIPGIGQATAVALIVEMPEPGQLDEKQAPGIAGPAPVARGSGMWRGKSFIRGGRAHLRPCPPDARRGRHVARSRPEGQISRHDHSRQTAKVAIPARMRKRVVLANTLLRNRRKWIKTIA